MLAAFNASLPLEGATLYGATAAGAAGRLYTINPATGAMIQDIGPLNDSLGTNYPITGLAFHPSTGVLYGSTASSDVNTRARLVTINPTNAAVTVIGPFNLTNFINQICTMADIAFDSVGNLYGVSTKGPHLCSVNLATGKATFLGPGAFNSTIGGALAISSDGVFYSSPTYTSSTNPRTVTFGTYNSADGEFTVITNIPLPASTNYADYGSFSFNENGVLFALNLGSGSPTPTHLFTVTTNGVAAEIGSSLNSLDAIAFQPSARPTLGISGPVNQQVTLRWPVATGFQLEYKTNLAAGSWLTNASTTTTNNGTNFLSVPTSGTASYFRLHKP